MRLSSILTFVSAIPLPSNSRQDVLGAPPVIYLSNGANSFHCNAGTFFTTTAWPHALFSWSITPNQDPKPFPQETLDAIESLINENPKLTSREAYEQVLFEQYARNMPPAQSPSNTLSPQPNSAPSWRESSDQLASLLLPYKPVSEYIQTEAMKLGLSGSQVRTPNFGAHTLDGIVKLQANNPELKTADAFEQLRGLDYQQTTGLLEFGLSGSQVRTPNFGHYTLDGIVKLQANNPELKTADAFEQLKGLDYQQTKGVSEFGLSNRQVRTPNFGHYTLDGIVKLQANNPELKTADAFEQLKGLDYQQTHERVDQLTRTEKPAPATNIFDAASASTIDKQPIARKI